MKQPSTLNGQELELFRVGDYGDKGSYTDADMQDLVARYSSGTHDEAAITAGHPASDSEPAYGWVKALRFEDGVLLGTAGEVNPDFDSAVVEKKAYKHRSVGFSRGRDGKLNLRHVAFLGAVPPAIKGLKVASFSSEPYQEFAFSEGDDMPEITQEKLNTSIAEGIAAWFSEKFGKKTEPTAVDANALAAQIKADLETKFSADLKAEKDARIALETKLAAQEKTFSDNSAQGRVATVIAGLKSSGAWIPAYDKIGVSALFSALAGGDKEITFSEADPKDATKTIEVKRDLVDAFSEVFKAVGQIVPKGRETAAASTTFSQALPNGNGAEIDPDSAARHAVVQKFADDNKVDYSTAYAACVAQGKMPQPGSAAAGSV